MQTRHRYKIWDARSLSLLEEGSVNLVVTSPPYPMIKMWDEAFSALNSKIGAALKKPDGDLSFELMHEELDKVWSELYRVLSPGGLACINIGDAVRKLGDDFKLFTNHQRLTAAMLKAGFDALPLILWRKQTSAPNKFMGSGVLPAGAYVTLEHEYILIFRKNGKRVFKTEKEKENRRQSAIFWEERNLWYSDLWTFKGVRQNLETAGKKSLGGRKRSAAFPFALPYRLINMFSVYGDLVLDPFAGTGTTMLAAMASGRHSLGLDNNPGLLEVFDKKITCPALAGELNDYAKERLEKHKRFIEEYTKTKGEAPRYLNEPHGFKVVSRQETRLRLFKVIKLQQKTLGEAEVTYQ